MHIESPLQPAILPFSHPVIWVTADFTASAVRYLLEYISSFPGLFFQEKPAWCYFVCVYAWMGGELLSAYLQVPRYLLSMGRTCNLRRCLHSLVNY